MRHLRFRQIEEAIRQPQTAGDVEREQFVEEDIQTGTDAGGVTRLIRYRRRQCQGAVVKQQQLRWRQVERPCPARLNNGRTDGGAAQCDVHRLAVCPAGRAAHQYVEQRFRQINDVIPGHHIQRQQRRGGINGDRMRCCTTRIPRCICQRCGNDVNSAVSRLWQGLQIGCRYAN